MTAITADCIFVSFSNMGYIKNEFLEEGQIVKGAIIALEDSLKIKRALSVTSDIDFYRYKVNFELISSD